jgi:hypothetical protein
MKPILVLLFASLAAAAFSMMPVAACGGTIFVAYGNTLENSAIGEWSTSGAVINASFATGTGADALAVAGGDLFAAAFSANLPTVSVYNAATGTVVNASLVGDVSTYAESIAVSGDNLFLGGGGGGVVKYDATTGTQFPFDITPQTVDAYGNPGIAVSGNDLFVTNTSLGTVGEYDATTGAAIDASFVAGLQHPFGIAVAGGDLFVTTQSGIAEYDAATGAAINASLITGLNGPANIAISGGDLFVGENNYPGLAYVGEYTTSGATINASLITGLITAGDFGLAVVAPEPSTWIMLAIGAAGLVACGLRKRRS